MAGGEGTGPCLCICWIGERFLLLLLALETCWHRKAKQLVSSVQRITMWPASPSSELGVPPKLWACSPCTGRHYIPCLVTWQALYTLLGNLAVIPAVWDAQNSMRSRLDPNETPEVKCKVVFRVVSILFCTKEDSAPVFRYSSGLVCLIAHFLSVPDLNDKYWLLEYLLSSSCVLALNVLEEAVVWDNPRFVFSVKYFCSWSYSWLPCSKAISVLPVAWLTSWNCKDRIYYALTIKF